MSEPRKNRLSIDGGQVKEDEHVATYKAIPESDTEFRSSKTNLGKSKEKISADGAEEKLLKKEDEAKIITRVDMSDAKYVVGDHRNGDAKIELDANKRQFTGMTREEVLKYADDPFWVNLRWSLFVLFWVAWLCMLAGAIAVIVRAPKCGPPEPRTWYELGPLVGLELVDAVEPQDLQQDLELLKTFKVQGVFVQVPTYEVLDKRDTLDEFKILFNKIKKIGIRVIVDLIPNYVFTNHTWFVQSENSTEPYTDYFIWTKEQPANWVSKINTPAFTRSDKRQMFYLHQFCDNCADLNFDNPKVVEKFDMVLKAWMGAGASGVRLNNARHLLVELLEEKTRVGRGSSVDADHMRYDFWEHKHTTDLPKLKELLARWSKIVTKESEPTVFTLKEDGSLPDLILLNHNVSMLRPPSAAPVPVTEDADALASRINKTLGSWPILQLTDTNDDRELASFAMLLPAAPLLNIKQLSADENDTSLLDLVNLRSDASLSHGEHHVAAAPARNASENGLIVCARWKEGHTGYMAVYNPSRQDLHANLTAVPSVPGTITIQNVSPAVKLVTNYTKNYQPAEDVLVPAKSTVVVSYVPIKHEKREKDE
ncbi:uncharacterized protein LOC114243828 [Bombyx mandarina]|uniref:alpha-glucosidase n=1 Tax=Bombyx mandarina TaxID=7092 RepID=A0A6J2JNX0_BOMMA|nr:uncharacterized protein LOC114243828 [Bombyx mandarina]